MTKRKIQRRDMIRVYPCIVLHYDECQRKGDATQHAPCIVL